jgi:hypothetical protein
MLRALSVADDWWAMQGYAEPKLPPWLVLGSETLTLQLAAGVVILLALGWRSRHMTALAWVSACAFQFTSRGTGDYHNAVLCTLLFWSLGLPTGHALSLDRRSGRWAAIAVAPKSSLRCCPAYGFPFAHVASARSRQLSTGDVGRPGGSAAGDILGPTGLVPTRPNLRIRLGLARWRL